MRKGPCQGLVVLHGLCSVHPHARIYDVALDQCLCIRLGYDASSPVELLPTGSLDGIVLALPVFWAVRIDLSTGTGREQEGEQKQGLHCVVLNFQGP